MRIFSSNSSIKSKQRIQSAYQSLRTWPSWFGVWLIQMLGYLPLPLLWALGSILGRLSYVLARSRRRIARRNLQLCLPEYSSAAREQLVRAHFGWLGVAALCQAVGWNASRARLARLVRFQGREYLEQCLAKKQPVILLVPHFVGLELAAAALSALIHPGVYMYQKIRNPVIERQVKHARQRFGSVSIERQDDLRGLVRELKRGTPFFYLPDQDGGRRGVFVPFCGIAASTVPMLGRFAAMTGAVVIPTFAQLRPWGLGLTVRFDPPLADFPSGNLEQDTARMNQIIESRLRDMPAQYFWVHQRFKTRPLGEAPLYAARLKKRG
ncbi:lysophospholipid acyltransferase family protein [Allochromatium warmingii]